MTDPTALTMALISILSNYCGEAGTSEGALETLQRIIAERDALKAALPETFYADRPLAERVGLLVQGWQKAVELGKEVDALKVDNKKWVSMYESWRPAMDAHHTIKQQVADLTRKLAEANEAVYVPGSWKCPQCPFGQVNSYLHLQSGTIGPNTDAVPLCPNDGSLMKRVTWKEYFADTNKRLGEELDLVDSLKAKLAESERALENARRHLRSTGFDKFGEYL